MRRLAPFSAPRIAPAAGGGFPVDRDPIVTAFNDAGPAYRSAGAPFLDACASLVLERLDLRAGQTVLDVACGPGTITLRAAEIVGGGGNVIGIDLAERQLELARRAAARQSGDAPMLFRREDASAPAMRERTADAVACGLGLPYLRTPLRAIREAVRVARPGGRLAWTSWGVPFFDRPGERTLQALARHDIPTFIRTPTLSPSDLAEWAFRAGLQDVVIEEHDLDAEFASIDAWWAMHVAFAHVPAVLPVPAADVGIAAGGITAWGETTATPEPMDPEREIRERLAADPSVVDEDGAVRCRLRVLLLHGAA
jgi:ubiquinone/menaquinone biosynthesis C-methylase UbiE